MAEEVKDPGRKPFEVDEIDDAALEGVSGGLTGDTNNGCNFAAGCGVATTSPKTGAT